MDEEWDQSIDHLLRDFEEAVLFDYKPHFEALAKLGCSEEYQMCGTRRNCSITTLWYCVSYCTKNCPEIAHFANGGGCVVISMSMFSSFYSILTNTTKRKLSRSNFTYACSQNLHNHFVLIERGISNYWFYHPYFLPEYPGPLTRWLVANLVFPWKRNTPKAVLEKLATCIKN